MLPTEQYSGDATQGPPWTPQVWRDGSDALVAQATAQLWQDSHDINDTVLGGADRAMAGSQTASQNETDQILTPAPQSRSQVWNTTVRNLYRDEPLAAWSTGAHDGPANPAP